MKLIDNWTTELRYKPYGEWSPEYITTLEKKAAASPWRLGYHIQPPTGLLNDPNGFSYFNGKWHLFYQAYPLGPVHGIKSWFHVTSADLVHWQEEGPALLPDGPFDSHGVYSGSAIPCEDKLFLAYTGNVRDENWQRHSYQLGAWLKADGEIEKIARPIIPVPPAGYTQEFRDPQVFRQGDAYYLIIGAQDDGEAGKVLTYKSDNLTGWELLGELDFTAERMGFMVECPNLVFADDKAIFLFCPQGLDKQVLAYDNIYPNTYVLADGFDGERSALTNVTALKNLDEGLDVYATQAFNAPDGRALAVSWIGLPEIAYPTDKEGWAHCLSLVKELLVVEGKLIQRPVVETMELRGEGQTFAGQLGAEKELLSPEQNRYELKLTFSEQSKGVVRLLGDGEEKGLTLTFDAESGIMTLDRSRAGETFAAEYGTVREFAISNQALELDIFVDTSVVEIYINGGEQVATARVFPAENQNKISLAGEGSFTAQYWPLGEMN